MLLNCFMLTLVCALTVLLCAEISCGTPLLVLNTNLRWDGSTNPGSVALYECVEGFYPKIEESTCSNTGQWGQVSLACKGRAIKTLPYRDEQYVAKLLSS